MAQIISSTLTTEQFAYPGSFTHVTRDGIINTEGAAINISAGLLVLPDLPGTTVSVDGTLLANIKEDNETLSEMAVIYSGTTHISTGIVEGTIQGGEDAHIRIGETGLVLGTNHKADASMYGVWMVSGQTLSNAGHISSATDQGVHVTGTGVTIYNSGTIEGGPYGVADALAVNGHHKLVNSGDIRGQVGVFLESDYASVSNSGYIHGSVNAVDLGENAQLINTGTIETWTTGAYAVEVKDGFHVTNHGLVSNGFYALADASGTIVNTGKIMSETKALSFDTDEFSFTSFTGGQVSIENSGTIMANDAVQLGEDSDTLQNSGDIDGTIEMDSSGASGNDQLLNSGTIAGSVDFYGGADIFRNSGEVEGLIDMGEGIDQFVNTGTVIGSIHLGDASHLGTDIDALLNSGSILGDVVLGSGNDLFNGLGGTVGLGVYGGTGDDTYIVDATSGALTELAGEGNDTVKAWSNHVLGDNFETLRLQGIDHTRGVGNSSDNRIVGNDGNNVLKGRAGDDTLSGGEGDDLLRGGAGADSMAGGEDDDRLISGSGNDLLNGDEGDDLLRGGKGKDTLNGGVDNDTLIGGRGADTLIGGYGDDVFRFTKASDNNAGSGYDRINDFARGQDLIDLSALNVELFVGGILPGGLATAITTEVNNQHTRIFIDMDRDGSADMRIDVRNTLNMTQDDFLI